MTETKDMLHRYLRDSREAVLWKVDGLSEPDLRRPHADATIASLDLDAAGRVPWWGEGGRPVTLHRIADGAGG